MTTGDATGQTAGTRDQTTTQSGQAATTPGTTPGTQTGQLGKPTQRTGQARLSERELRRHARAHVMIEQQAPDVYARLATVKDAATELSAEERQKLAQVLKGAGYTLQQFSREHRQIASNPQLMSKLQRYEQRAKAQGTSGAAAPAAGASPGGSSGAQSPSAQPGASPK